MGTKIALAGNLDLVDLTGRRLSSESLASLRFLGNKNASIFAPLGSLLARTSGSRPVIFRSKKTKNTLRALLVFLVDLTGLEPVTLRM